MRVFREDMEVVWVRRDARLHDNMALHEAAHSGRPVCVIFVFDDRWVQGIHCHFSHCEFVAQGFVFDITAWSHAFLAPWWAH